MLQPVQFFKRWFKQRCGARANAHIIALDIRNTQADLFSCDALKDCPKNDSSIISPD